MWNDYLKPVFSSEFLQHCLAGWKGTKPYEGNLKEQWKGFSLGLSEEIGTFGKKISKVRLTVDPLRYLVKSVFRQNFNISRQLV